MEVTEKNLLEIIDFALTEDVGDGDHTSLACVPKSGKGKARLLIKDKGILAGVELAKIIFHRVDPILKIEVLKNRIIFLIKSVH